MRRRIHACHMRRRIHACHRRRRIHACHMRRIHACHMRRRIHAYEEEDTCQWRPTVLSYTSASYIYMYQVIMSRFI